MRSTYHSLATCRPVAIGRKQETHRVLGGYPFHVNDHMPIAGKSTFFLRYIISFIVGFALSIVSFRGV